MKILRFAVCFAVLVLMGSHHLEAQDATSGLLSGSEIETTLLEHERQIDRDRQAIRDLLADPVVQDLAHERGVDTRRLDEAVQTMDEAQIERLAPMVDELQASMQTRATVTISAGALLLALILVLLLA